MAIATALLSTLSVKLLKDTALAVIGRIAWPVVLERLLTRVMIACLQKLKTLSTNDVVDETVDLIVAMLEEKRLAKASEFKA